MPGSIAGALIGNSVASGQQDQDTAARQAALQQYLNIQAPSIAEQQLALQQEQVAGALNPSMQGANQQGTSTLAGIQTNPAYTQATNNTLQQLGQLAQGGLNAQDRAALLQINQQAAGQAEAGQKAALANMAARGMGGGGAELAARLSASQNAANMGAQAGLGVASQAQARANQALMAQGQLGQSLQGQQFGQLAQQAQSQNAINQFNTQLRQQATAANTAAQNQAQLFNLQNAQNVGNTNTGIANQQQQYNKGLYQQQFNNQMGVAGGVAGQENNLGNYYGQQAAGTRGMWSGIGQGVDQGLLGGFMVAKNMSGGGGGSSGGNAGGGAMSQGQVDNVNNGGYSNLTTGGGGGYNLGMYSGGMVPGYADGGVVDLAAKYGPILQFLKEGGVVKGEAKVEGDSENNDTVHAMLSPDEAVIPRSKMTHPDKAHDYIDGLFAAMGKK